MKGPTSNLKPEPAFQRVLNFQRLPGGYVVADRARRGRSRQYTPHPAAASAIAPPASAQGHQSVPPTEDGSPWAASSG